MNQNPDWLPNWKGETSYNFPESDNLTLWAWEFLRRNPEYQRAWQENYVEGRLKWVLENANKMESGSNDELKKSNKEKEHCFESRFCDPPALHGETEYQWLARVGKGRTTPWGVHLASQFKLDGPHLCNPAKNFHSISDLWAHRISSTNRVSFTNSWGPSFLVAPVDSNQTVGSMKPEKPGDVIVRFDLNQPIARQWKKIKDELEVRKEYLKEQGVLSSKDKKRHVHLYPSYLRVLDGEASGASVSEMASVIFPNKDNRYAVESGDKTVRNSLKAAKKLRDEGYQFLALK